MKRLTLILAMLAGFAFTASASAHQPVYTPASALAAAEQAAIAYHTPACGQPLFAVDPSPSAAFASATPSTCSTTLSLPLVAAAAKSPADFMSLCEVATFEDGQLDGTATDPNFNQTSPQCVAASSHFYEIYGHVARATVVVRDNTCIAHFRYVPKLRYHTNHLASQAWPCAPLSTTASSQ